MNALADQMEERAAGTQVARQERHMTAIELVEKNKVEIARALPGNCTPERFARIITTSLRMTPELQTCTAESLMGAVMLCAQCGLEPGPLEHAYLVPFKDHGVPKVTLIVGYKGMVDLAYRSPQVSSIVGRTVKENDEYECDFGLNERLVHVPAKGDRGASVAYYVIVRLVGGGHVLHAMSRDDVEDHRRCSRIRDSGPWKSNYDPMATKTVLRVMSPWVPKSIEFARALAADETVTETIEPDLADRQAPIRVESIDVPDDDPEPDDPRGAGTSPGPVVSEGGSVDGVGSAPSGDAPAPSTTADNVAGAADTPVRADQGASHRPPAAAPAATDVELVNDEGAQMIGKWCADAGIGDDLRPAFLFALVGVLSAHEVAVDSLGDVRSTLHQVKSGQLVLDVDPDGVRAPSLRVPGDSSESPAGEPPPAALTWRAVLGNYRGIGQAKLLRKARDLAGELGVALPTSLDDIDAALNVPLRAWLDEQAAA